MKKKKLLVVFFIASTLFAILNTTDKDTMYPVANINNEVSSRYFDINLINYEERKSSLNDFEIRGYAFNHNFSLNSFDFTTTNYPNNYSISESDIVFDNLKINTTLIDYNELSIVYLDFKFLESRHWNVELDFLGEYRVLQIAQAQSVLEEENSHRIIDRELLNMESIGTQFYILHYFSVSTILKVAFLILPEEFEEDYDNLVNNKGLLDAFEVPFKGKFLQTNDENGMIIYCPNIYELTSYATKSFNAYILYGNEIFYTIGEIYIFLYWKLQVEYYNHYNGAVPDLSYWQRINGEVFKPETTVHIRNLGDSIRHFLFCRRYMRFEDSYYVNQSITKSLEYLEDETVFQTFKKGKFWSHDIHLGKLNKEWILNAHTGSILTLILARNEGFDINQELLDNAIKLLLDNFWDFDMGFNRISYAIWNNGVYQSFTSKSDNYELLISLDFIMMFRFLSIEQKEVVSQYLKYMYIRYTKLDESYIQTLPNQRILFDLSVFFEENHFLSYFKNSYWYERTIQENNAKNNYGNYSVYRIFGTEDYFVISNIEQITFDELNISLEDVKAINFYNLTSHQSLIFKNGSFDQLLGKSMTEEICLIFYFEDGLTHNQRINKYGLVYLIVIGQIIIVISIIGFSFYRRKKNQKNKTIRNGIELYEKLMERKLLTSILNLTLFTTLIALPIILRLDQNTYSLSSAFSIFVRRIILYPSLVKGVLVFSLVAIILYLSSRFLEKLKIKNQVFVNTIGSSSYNKIINISRFFIIPLYIFVMNSIWGLALDQSFSQSNLAYIILYIIQLLTINLILFTSNVIPFEENIFNFKYGKTISKVVFLGGAFLVFALIIFQFASLMKSTLSNSVFRQMTYFTFLLLISTFIILTIVDYLLRRKPMKFDLALLNVISLMILIYPTFFVDMLTITDISNASFYSDFGIWMKILLLLLFFGFVFKKSVKTSSNKKGFREKLGKYASYGFTLLTLFAVTISITILPFIYNISNVIFLMLNFTVYFYVVLSSKNLIITNFTAINNN